MQKITQEITIGSKKITLETGKLAPQANASVVARSGDTVVLATVVMGKLDQNKDYFPLSVEFADKLYAGGIVKGGKWVKRELNPSDNAILFGRVIDRSIRPLFPAGFQNEVQIITTILSNDKENDTIIPAFLAVSAALSISDIPFKAPVSAIRIGQVAGNLVVGPTLSELSTSDLDLLVCTGSAGINMIEAGSNIVSNELMYSAIELAKTTGDQVNAQLSEFATKYGKPKSEFKPVFPTPELLAEVKKHLDSDIQKFLEEGVDGAHMAGEEKMIEKLTEIYQSKIKSEELSLNLLILAFNEVIKKALRDRTLAGKRYDKRAMDEVRPLYIEAGLLPCTHGSALFQRGLTQALTITALSTLSEKQTLQDSTGETTKRYIHFYSAAPFSTGQTGRVGRPGRREIGHGALAEKALIPVIPSPEEFPYTIVLTSEVLSQNGSSSMASTCGSTMSLMDAGVPIKDKVAGISIGLIAESDDKYILLTDIAGIEDHNGDMDFKITGTRNGITAIQLDIKREGLTLDMIKNTFIASTKARMNILDQMDAALAAPRSELSKYAPKIVLVKLPEDKIGEVIGSGGKTIKGLMERYGVQIDIDDEGNASISSHDSVKIGEAAFAIESMVKDIQIGEEYDGIVTRVENYGAFVEFLPGREALLHVSELSTGFISDPSSIIKVGDSIHIKVSGFNDNHQIKLAAPEFKAAHPGQERGPDQQPQGNRAGFDRFDSRSQGGFRGNRDNRDSRNRR